MSGEFAIPTCARKAAGDPAAPMVACDAHRARVSEAHQRVYGVGASWVRVGP